MRPVRSIGTVPESVIGHATSTVDRRYRVHGLQCTVKGKLAVASPSSSVVGQRGEPVHRRWRAPVTVNGADVKVVLARNLDHLHRLKDLTASIGRRDCHVEDLRLLLSVPGRRGGAVQDMRRRCRDIAVGRALQGLIVRTPRAAAITSIVAVVGGCGPILVGGVRGAVRRIECGKARVRAMSL